MPGELAETVIVRSTRRRPMDLTTGAERRRRVVLGDRLRVVGCAGRIVGVACTAVISGHPRTPDVNSQCPQERAERRRYVVVKRHALVGTPAPGNTGAMRR